LGLMPTPHIVSALLSFVLASCAAHRGVERPPNFVVLFADDLGYGDLGCYGHPTISTPNLDRMAREGIRFTQFYSACSVCTPSRAALLTGRFPIRSGMASSKRRVLFPNSRGGLPASEITLAEGLKTKGYATACIGKWHLGHRPEFLPTQNGFDSYFGLPYSNDMDRVGTAPKGRAAFLAPKSEYWNVPLIRDEKIIERPAEQTTLTKRYTEEAETFIRANAERPFLLYLPYSMVHVPLFASTAFQGKSARGLYGDAMVEIFWSVGWILDTLRALGIDENTLVFFTSDNGPWLTFGEHGGSAGLLRMGKGSTWEGGMREPCVAWWPGGIGKPGCVSEELGSTMDIFTTCLTLAGVALPRDRAVDGVDLTPVLRGTGPSPRKSMAFYRGTELWAWRSGAFKAHFKTRAGYGREKAKVHNPPLLFHLNHDPSEQNDVATSNAEVLLRIEREIGRHRETVRPVVNQLERR
jgi:arylsulfatase A